ncbi:MAG: hypothetical protein ABEJ42_03750, partial [Halobacteriaceae archaeon]
MGTNSEHAGLATPGPRPDRTEDVTISVEPTDGADDGVAVAALEAEVRRLEDELDDVRAELRAARAETTAAESELEVAISQYERRLAAREEAHEERPGDRGPPPGKPRG